MADTPEDKKRFGVRCSNPNCGDWIPVSSKPMTVGPAHPLPLKCLSCGWTTVASLPDELEHIPSPNPRPA
jgi:hypothetical protein